MTGADPTIRFPEELPVTAARERIAAAIAEHPVVIVAGATGSGKTTQLPKICLAAGRGRDAMIGHTQPRRLAARAVAERIADELGVALGDVVGYQVRFEAKAGPRSRIKLMTDGILLNEIRRDRDLAAYDTIIVDEAHERTVNIDFLLGYLKLVLRRRPELRVVVTSATVDADAFSEYFDGAPVIDVEGRTFPVDIEYREPPADQTLSDAVVDACNEIAGRAISEPRASRDVLVFLPGEQAIRETRSALEKRGPAGWEVLPLYARLPARLQRRVFAPGSAPRIILATNIAETSLTVPRIRYVVDSGLARVSRYSARHRIDTLRIEPVARANAIQRAGRSGRLAPGVCIRLYSESDFDSRPAFTDPELRRTNLAGVLLRVRSLGFRSIDAFPFLDPPDPKFVNDAERLLAVLGAIDDRQRLTKDGRLMARLPLDPRLSRLLLEGRRRHCLDACLVIAAAISAGDPRESVAPGDDTVADERERTADRRSDFMTLYALWLRYREARRGGAAAVRGLARKEGLAENRLREWDDVHAQLVQVAEGLGWHRRGGAPEYRALHKSILAAFVDYIACHVEKGDYEGMHGVRARLFPGSTVAAARPNWVVAAEHVATERNYLRTVARIEPRWVEEVAPHLLKRSLGDPHWDVRRGQVTAPVTVSAFGLVLAAGRRVEFGPLEPERARDVFIDEGLAPNRIGARFEFASFNAAVKARIQEWEARRRSRDLYIGDRGLARFYRERLPADVHDRRALAEWCRDPANDAALRIDTAGLATADLSATIDADYPTSLECAGQRLSLDYRFDPGTPEDGVSLTVPAVLIDSVPVARPDWLVPGYLEEKVRALLRTLPKELRRPLVPLPDTAAAIIPALRERFGQGALVDAIAEAVSISTGRPVPASAFAPERLEPHLRMRVVLLGADGEPLASDRDFRTLRRAWGGARTPVGTIPEPDRGDRLHPGWEFGDLPERVEVERYGTALSLYPALLPAGRGVRVELLPPGPSAVAVHRLGVRHLVGLELPQQAGLLRGRVQKDRALILAYHGLGATAELGEDVVAAAAEAAFDITADCRTAAAFRALIDRGRSRFVAEGEAVIETLREVLELYRPLRKVIAAVAEAAPEAAADLGAQLDRLIYPGFVAATPPPWLKELPRYLRAMALRADSLRYRNDRDARDRALAAAAEARWLRYAETLPAGWPLPASVERYRWLTEELRVSLFAQNLGTVTAVSGKRLERFWREQVD